MAWESRDYYREPRYGGGGFGGAQFMINVPSRGSVTLWLLVINVAIFFLGGLFNRGMGYDPLTEFGFFSIAQAFERFQVWRLLTFQFLHADGWHLFGNMLMLFFFGPMVEGMLSRRRFLAFYLLCGLAGVLGYMFFWATGILVVTTETPMVGASAGVFGVLAAAAVVAPNARVLLFFLIPVPLRALIIVLLVVSAYVVLARGAEPGVNAGGEAAHLGGALLGFILIKRLGWLNWADRFEVGAMRERWQERREQRQRATLANEQQEVDRILDKVRQHGLQSLTRAEKKALGRATERQRRGG
jgi:membrane associated rhomboid family serine protease